MKRALMCLGAFGGGFLFAAWLNSLSQRARLMEHVEQLLQGSELEWEDE